MSNPFANPNFLTVSWLLIIAPGAVAAMPPCTELQGATPKQELAYLDRDRVKLNPGCVVYAIEQLGFVHYSRPGEHSTGAEIAADMLTTYLDFRMPGTEKMDRRRFASHIQWLGNDYPAVTALFGIGKPSVLSLVRAIGSRTSSDLVRKNAIQTLFYIHRENFADGARVLANASRSAQDAETATRLWEAAREYAAICRGPFRNGCDAALFER